VSRPSDAHLLRHLCSANDPNERADLRHRIREDVALQARVVAWSARLDAPEPAVRWPIPPPGFGHLPLRSAARAMGDGRAHALVFPVPEDAARQVVVLWNTGDGWEPLTPQSEGDVLTPADLPRDSEEHAVLDIVLPEGASQWAVALPRPDEAPDWTADDPWDRFRAAVYRGVVPLQVVHLPG